MLFTSVTITKGVWNMSQLWLHLLSGWFWVSKKIERITPSVWYLSWVCFSHQYFSAGTLRTIHTRGAKYFTRVNGSDVEGVHAAFTNSPFHTGGVEINTVVKTLTAVESVWGIRLGFWIIILNVNLFFWFWLYSVHCLGLYWLDTSCALAPFFYINKFVCLSKENIMSKRIQRQSNK